MVDQETPNRLLNPVTGVGGEPAVSAAVEALDGTHQAEVALGDEILQRQPATLISPRNIDHEAEVSPDQVIAGVGITGCDPIGQVALVLNRKQRGLADVAQIGLETRGAVATTWMPLGLHEFVS
jgi:hypothetical protein